MKTAYITSLKHRRVGTKWRTHLRMMAEDHDPVTRRMAALVESLRSDTYSDAIRRTKTMLAKRSITRNEHEHMLFAIDAIKKKMSNCLPMGESNEI